MPDWLVTLGQVSAAILSVAALIALVVKAVPRVRAGVARMNRAVDVVLGSPAIPDPDRPGQNLRDEIPDIGVRMTRQEQLLQEVVLGSVEEARAAARSAAESAASAASSAAAAKASAEAAERIVAQAIGHAGGG